ncbi:MAG: hypothetical protein AB7P37_21140 [Ramlibacter sp.]
MLTPPTDQQVADEIAKLREIKPRVRRYTAFGDDNHALIDAQIDVLECRFSNDDVHNMYPIGTMLLDNAIDAVDFLEGNGESLCDKDGWGGLVV